MSSNFVEDFMDGALVTWIRTFENDGGGSLTYAALADGVYLYDVMTHISPRGGELVANNHRPLNRCPEDPHTRLSNLTILLNFIRAFYQEVLGQLLLSALPDVVKLSRAPDTEGGAEELKKLLLLVLGCAVQSPLKEDVIANIKGLSLDTQHDIVSAIQEITDNVETVWPPEWSELENVPSESLPRAFEVLVHNCRRLATERDLYWQDLLKSLLGGDEDSSEESQENVHHLGVQLAQLKSQLRRLRQDYDEKSETNAELKEEQEQLKTVVDKLRQENIELIQDARAARAWRDEADILRERAARVDGLETEVTRYRDKMADIEFYKTRVDELREDNRILVETKEMLEEQLLSSRRKAEQVLDLENTILQLKQSINHLNIERDADRDRFQELIEENAQLQLTSKNSLSESATLAAQMDSLRSKAAAGSPGRNIGSDIAGDAATRVLKLDLENQRLEAELAKLRQESLHASSDKILELEKENKRLSLKVEHLQELSQKEKAQVLMIQEELHVKQKDGVRLQDTISTIKANSDRQNAELQKEANQLQELIDNLRERQQKTTQGRLIDVEKENKELTDLNMSLQNQVTRLEFEKQQLNKITERLKESAEKLTEVEHQKAEIERENRDLHLAMNTFKESCERYEKMEHDYASLEVEYNKVSRTLDNTKDTLSKLESAQGEKLQLQVEVERLNRSLTSLKSSSTKLADLELEKDQLLHHNNQLQKQVSSLQCEKTKAEQMEIEMMSSTTEIQKLKRSIETNHKRLLYMEKEKGEMEAENTKLLRTIETLKISTRKLNEVERDLTELEGVNDRLDRENRSFKKEADRLKASTEMKDNLIDEASSKASKFERENRKLLKEVESLRTNNNRIKLLEQERREIDQQTVVERKTLSTLREDLVAEKVRTQQLSNQLESLTSDLSKLGLNAANLSPPVSDADDERCKALESMLEETLKRSVEIREEKISSLESRLSQSVSRNQQLRNQLLQVKSDYECLLQRHQEEGVDLSQDATREMSKLKESLMRSTEDKTSLENEVSVLGCQNASYREQVCALQSQVTSLSNQNTVLSKHNATLQGESARLQVENTTLQSQSASIIAQNSTLQTNSAQLEAERDKAKRSLDERGSRLNQLINDHEALQKLHRQLTQEYESLTKEHNTLKTSQKNLIAEAKLLKDRQTNLSSNEDELLRLRESLEDEMATLKKDSTSLSNLRAEHSRLKDDFRSLFSANERLRAEYKNLQGDYKAVKTENNTMKLKCTELSGELNEVRDQLASLDVETSKLTNKCQVLQDLNLSLEEDRRSLMSQVSLLLTQYHDLLTQTLEDKQHFHQEEKNFTDKVNNLRRQKEKLEEKIMEQYRRMDNSPHKKRGFGSTLVKRVRKAGNDLINKVPRSGRSRSRGREDGEDETQDSSSLGSSQANDSLDSGSETRRSTPNLPPSPQDSSAGEGTPTERKGSFAPLTPKGSRKSLPPSISELFLSNSLSRDSISSDDIGPPSDTTESTKEDECRIPQIGPNAPTTNGNVELCRAGSRKTLYILPDADSDSKKDLTADQLRGRSSNRSISSISLNHSRTAMVNGSSLSSIPGTPRKSGTGAAPPPPPRSSTPLHSTNALRGEKRFGEEETRTPLTPKLPPRVDQNNQGAPQLPPRSRRGSNQTPDSSLSSSQPTSACGTPELRKKSSLLQGGSSPPHMLPLSDLPQKPPPTQPTKDGVDNSIWYEYGCV